MSTLSNSMSFVSSSNDFGAIDATFQYIVNSFPVKVALTKVDGSSFACLHEHTLSTQSSFRVDKLKALKFSSKYKI